MSNQQVRKIRIKVDATNRGSKRTITVGEKKKLEEKYGKSMSVNDAIRAKNWKGPNNGYVKKKLSKQDKMTPEEIAEKLQHFELIEPDEYDEIPKGTFVRYITEDGKYRHGGVLTKNAAPKYWGLRNPQSNANWTVQLKGGNKYYYVPKEKQKELREFKKELLTTVEDGGKVITSDDYEELKRNISAVMAENEELKGELKELRTDNTRLRRKLRQYSDALKARK